MFRKLPIVCYCAVMCLLAAYPMIQVSAQEEKPAEKPKAKAKEKSAPGLQGYYAIVAGELKLTDEQRQKLIAALGERNEALKAWDQEHGGKLTEQTAAQKQAREAKDAAASKKAGDSLRELRAARAAVAEGGKARLIALLTPEQRLHLQGYDLYVGAMSRFAPAKLTDEQKAKAKVMALAAGRYTGTPDEVALDNIKAELAAKVDKEILTDDQRQAMATAAEEKGKGKGKGKAPTPAPKAE